MSYRINVLSKKKARKNYPCLWCRKVINKGDHYSWRKWKGIVYHYHIDCVRNAVECGCLVDLMEKEG